MLIGKPTLLEYARGGYNITCIVTGGKWRQNAYIVTQMSSLDTIIVDPGDRAELIIEHIQEGGGKVIRLLLTHPHHDHVGAVAQLSEHFEVPCELHTQDVRLLMHAPMYALRFANRALTPISHFRHFAEMDPSGAGPSLRSIHTPGHTKGSVCYLFDGFVLTGDTLLYEHVGRTDLPGGNADEIAGSIRKILSQLNDEILIFPGHGKPWTIGEAKTWWRKMEATPPKYENFDQL